MRVLRPVYGKLHPLQKIARAKENNDEGRRRLRDPLFVAHLFKDIGQSISGVKMWRKRDGVDCLHAKSMLTSPHRSNDWTIDLFLARAALCLCNYCNCAFCRSALCIFVRRNVALITFLFVHECGPVLRGFLPAKRKSA